MDYTLVDLVIYFSPFSKYHPFLDFERTLFAVAGIAIMILFGLTIRSYPSHTASNRFYSFFNRVVLTFVLVVILRHLVRMGEAVLGTSFTYEDAIWILYTTAISLGTLMMEGLYFLAFIGIFRIVLDRRIDKQ